MPYKDIKIKKTALKSYIILDNIRSAQNVGSIFRTADAVDIEKIYITGITPSPIDRFGRKRADIHKSALGAEEIVQWEEHEDAEKLIEKLRKDGVYIVAVEQARDSVDYKKINIWSKSKIGFVFGNEVKGLSPTILKQCDVIAEIPMLGKKESLNVAVSVGVVLSRMLDI